MAADSEGGALLFPKAVDLAGRCPQGFSHQLNVIASMALASPAENFVCTVRGMAAVPRQACLAEESLCM